MPQPTDHTLPVQNFFLHKMNSNNVRILLTFYCFHACVNCMNNYKCFSGHLQHRKSASRSFDHVSKFNQSLDDLPLHLAVNDTQATRDNTTIPSLNVSISGVREDVLLILFAIPFNTSECPARLTGNEDLRQYRDAFDVPANVRDFVVDFNCIFTGCYYFMMVNKEGKKWQSELRYYRRNYTFGDRKITTIGKPMYNELSRIMEVDVKLPLYCIKGDVFLCDLLKKDNMTKPVAIRKYNFGVENASAPLIIRPWDSGSNSHAKLEAHISGRRNDSEETIVSMKWSNLEQGHKYYLKIQSDWHPCKKEDPDVNIRLWDIPGIYTYAYPEYRIDKPEIPSASNVLEIACIALVSSATCAILVYWVFKCVKLRINPVNSESQKLTKFTVPPNEKRLNQILLIYEKGSPKFMEAMQRFRKNLKQKCICEVHEVYSREDFDNVARLTPAGWLREHMYNGSKFVWVDTPEFRSRFRDGNQQNASSDFRTNAVQYAVSLTKNLSPNAPSQYVCHFVVRVKGFEVDDERENDPLLIVSPQTRYFIPEHLDRLCEHLKNPTDRPEETSIKVPSSHY